MSTWTCWWTPTDSCCCCCRVHLRAVCLQPFGSIIISWVQLTIDSWWLVGWSLTSLFSTNMAISETTESWWWFALRLRDLRHLTKSLAGSSGSLSACWQGSTFGLGLLVASSVPSVGCCQYLRGYWQWGRHESEVLTRRTAWDDSQNDGNINHRTQMPSSATDSELWWSATSSLIVRCTHLSTITDSPFMADATHTWMVCLNRSPHHPLCPSSDPVWQSTSDHCPCDCKVPTQ